MTDDRRERLRQILGDYASPAKLDAILSLFPDEEPLEALRALVFQLKDSGWKDKFGHPIENNVAFREAVALVTLAGPGRRKPASS